MHPTNQELATRLENYHSKGNKAALTSAFGLKLIEQFPEALGVVTLSVFEFICRFGLNQVCIGVENEDMRVAMDIGKPRQESLIWILLAHADFHRHVVLVSKRREVRVLAKEGVHGMAPTAPFTPDHNKDISLRPPGLRADHRKVFFRVTPRVIPVNHFIVRLRRVRFLYEKSLCQGWRRAKANHMENCEEQN